MKKSHYLVAIDPKADSGSRHFEWIKEKFLSEGDCISIIAVLPEGEEIDASGSDEMARMQIQSLLSTIKTADVEKKTFVVFGKPSAEIVKLGNTLDPTAIVMCSSGKNTLTTFVLGSVCENVLKASKIPVMILK